MDKLLDTQELFGPLIDRRVNHQMIHIANISRITPTRTGSNMDNIDSVVETTSSIMLTGTFPVPAVVAVMAGLTAAAFTAWTVPATSNPAAMEMMGWISVITVALAANRIAPAAGRMNV